MKRKIPEGGFDNESIQEQIKRAYKVTNIENIVEMRKKTAENKENASSNPAKKRKTFKDILSENNHALQSQGTQEEAETHSKLVNFKAKISSMKLQSERKPKEGTGSQFAPGEDSVHVHQLFPALINETDSDVIRDYSLKSKIKILSTKSMDWINTVTFDRDDTEMKSKLHEVLDYYTYPSSIYDIKMDRLCDTQLSSMNAVPNISEIDKEWFSAFKDCYVKWLSFEDSEGKLMQFSVITKHYKTIFISKGYIIDDKLVRKRFAVVGNPSDKLIEMLTEAKVRFNKFKKPVTKVPTKEKGDGTLIDDFGLQEEPATYRDEVDLININLVRDTDPTTLLIEDFDLHGLVNILINLCTPYLKEVKLVASYSFTNSVHRTADITYNGKVHMHRDTSKFNTSDRPEETKLQDWYGVELKGMYSFGTVKRLAELFTNRLTKNLKSSNDSASEILKIS